MRRQNPPSGQSLVELVIAMGVGLIVALGMASVFAFGIEQFNILVDQNRAEESLLQASFLIRSYMSQAVKTGCGSIAAGGTLNTAATDDPPLKIGRGIVNCATSDIDAPNPALAPSQQVPATRNNKYVQNTQNILAAFVRETGGQTAGVGGLTNLANSSVYAGTTITFLPPNSAGRSGTLYFATSVAGNIQGSTAWGLDHFVDVGFIIPSPPATTPSTFDEQSTGFGPPYYNLRTLTARLIVRYFVTRTGDIDFRRVPGATTPAFRDIEMIIPINFRDNFLGVSAAGMASAERLYGGIYFYKFTAPSLVNFTF